MTQAQVATAPPIPPARSVAKRQDQGLPIKRYRLADVATFPTEDGHRYEIIDGELIVTPAPARPHGIIASRIAYAITKHFKEAKPDWSLIGQPINLGWETETTSYHCEPDISIFDRSFGEVSASESLFPVIVIEIVSPATRRTITCARSTPTQPWASQSTGSSIPAITPSPSWN